MHIFVEGSSISSDQLSDGVPKLNIEEQAPIPLLEFSSRCRPSETSSWRFIVPRRTRNDIVTPPKAKRVHFPCITASHAEMTV